MRFLQDFFDREKRQRSRIQSLTKKAQQKYGQTEDRYAAVDGLKEIGGEEAWRGLLKRFTVTVDNKLHDQDEKKYVSDILAERGPEIVPLLKEFLAREVEVTWAARTLARVVPNDERVSAILDCLRGRTSEETDPEKLVQLLTVLHEEKDPRAIPVVADCLKDLDDTVRIAAVETLATIGSEEARLPLLEALVRPEEDSQRVVHRIVEIFRDRQWEVRGYRKSVEERLPERNYLDRSGRIKALEPGSAREPEDGS